MAKCASPVGTGKKDRYSGIGCELLLPPFCWHCMCVVCAREDKGRLKGLCLLF